MTSIRRRILLPLTPLTALSLALTAAWIYLSIRQDLMAGIDKALLAKARTVGVAVEVDLDGKAEFDLEDPAVLGADDSGRNVFYTVRFEDGEILRSSLEIPPESFAAPEKSPFYTTRIIGEIEYRICQTSIVRETEDDEEDRERWLVEHPGEQLPKSAQVFFWIEAGQSTQSFNDALDALAARLTIGFGGLLIFLLLIPAWVVAAALKPIKRLSAQADGLGPDEPLKRLDGREVDLEILSLVAALNRALDRLTQALERQKRFAADAAHELRTPLTAIRTQCEVVLRKERSVDELRETLETVLQTALRMADLVENLLTVARIQQEEELHCFEDVSLDAACREAIKLNKAMAGEKGVALKAAKETEAKVRGDERLLVECISNLIENAIRYTSEGGHVSVSTGISPCPTLTVSDTGIGIPPEHKDRIFERFHRVDKARSRVAGGAGLGLSIVKEIARLHDAEIEVQSEVGKGSRFILRFPINFKQG